MLARQRLDRIVNALQDQDFLDVAEACALVDASPATIRRDFAELVAQGRADRLRGGVGRPRRDALAMIPFATREVRHAAAKSAIARHAAGVLQAGDAAFIDGGTSTLHLASHLGEAPVRVITNSLRLAAAIGAARYEHPVEVHCTGGLLVPRGGLLIGPQARAGIDAYRARWAILSAGGITTEGVFNTDGMVQEVEQSMIAHAERVMVLADHTKLGINALCRVCPLERVRLLITDRHPGNDGVLPALRSAGIEVVEVDAPADAPGQA